MLTDTAIRKLTARKTAYRLSDGGGLYLQITPAGGKLWRWEYRYDGREKLMALTFVRTSELINAKWAEFDLEAARWDIPAERMKMRTPHIVPLARQTLDVLAILQTLTGKNEWLFPGERSAKKPMSNNTILAALERMGYKGRMTGHGFLGLASTVLHEQGYNHEHIELQLAHAPRNAVSAQLIE